MLIDPAAARDREQQQRDADQGAFEHPARPDVAHVEADQNRDGDGGRDRRGRPRAVLHRIDHDEAQHRDQDDHDHHYADQRGDAADGAEFVARHLAERAAVASRREKQHDEVLYAAAQHRADQDPQRAGQVAELRGEGRPDQRAGAGDGGEVVTEHHPFVGGDEVTAVVEALGRRRAGRVERKYFSGDEGAVETVADGVDAHRRDDEPQTVDGLAARQCDATHRRRAKDRDRYPHQDRPWPSRWPHRCRLPHNPSAR